MVVRRMVTESKAAFAGRIVEVFARSKASIAAFKSTSGSFGRWESVFMVERGSCERTVQHEGCEDGSEPQFPVRFRTGSYSAEKLVPRALPTCHAN